MKFRRPQSLPVEYWRFPWDETIFSFWRRRVIWTLGFSICGGIVVFGIMHQEMLESMPVWCNVIPFVVFAVGMGIIALGGHFARCRKCGSPLTSCWIKVDHSVLKHMCEIRGYNDWEYEKLLVDVDHQSASVAVCLDCQLKALIFWTDNRGD